MDEFLPTDQYLVPSSPRLAYQEGKKPNVFHAGQRKLFFGELQFILQYVTEPTATIVYVGSSPGYHLNAIFPLFPHLTWHNYDIRPPMYDYTGYQVTVHTKYFTDSDAEYWRTASLTHPVYFMSDIRKEGKGIIYEMYQQRESYYQRLGLVLIPKASNDDFEVKTYKPGARAAYDRLAASAGVAIEEDIEQGMRNQLQWHRTINPRKSHLKFRLPWKYTAESRYRYANGTILWQIYSRPTSTETRFVPNDQLSEAEWSPEIYDQQCFYHNQNRSSLKFRSYQTGDRLNFDDAEAEYLLLYYIQYHNPEWTYERLQQLLADTMPIR